MAAEPRPALGDLAPDGERSAGESPSQHARSHHPAAWLFSGCRLGLKLFESLYYNIAFALFRGWIEIISVVY